MTSQSVKISALIVAHNEESIIEDALKSAAFCDEIVVVLDRCTDNTKAVCEKYTKNILEGAWEIEGERRNLGIEKCVHDWILEIDADERVAEPLAKEIRKFVQTAPDGHCLIPVQNYVGKRLVQHGWAGSFGTTRAKKLFKKGCKIWGAQRAHPALELNGEALEVGMDLGPGEGLVHLVDKDINDMIDRMQRYSDAMAQDWRDRGHQPKFKTSLRRAATRFYKSYWARKGYKEGRYGFLLALMAALTVIFTHIKAELE